MQKIIKNYEKACDDIADRINKIYFNGEQDIYWICNEIGGVCNMGDWYFDMDYMINALKYGATEKQFFDYYDIKLEKETKGDKMEYNFKNYILYYKGFKI